MFKATDTPWAPWYVVHSDDKRRARLNIISHVLKHIPYKETPREKVKLPERLKAHGYQEPDYPYNVVPNRHGDRHRSLTIPPRWEPGVGQLALGSIADRVDVGNPCVRCGVHGLRAASSSDSAIWDFVRSSNILFFPVPLLEKWP